MKQQAREAFEQLAEAYLIKSSRSEEAQVFVRDLRAMHNNAINDYFYQKSGQHHSQKALKNDTQGVAGKWKK